MREGYRCSIIGGYRRPSTGHISRNGIQGDWIRANAYGKAAQNVLGSKEDVEILSKEGRSTSIEGVGASIAKKIDELIKTETTETFETLRNSMPEDLGTFREIPFAGTKLVTDMIRDLGITSVEDLLVLTRSERLVQDLDIDGTFIEKLAEHLRWRREEAAEVPTPHILGSVRRVLGYFLNDPMLKVIAFTGPARRMVTEASNVTFLFISDRPDMIISRFGLCPEVEELTMGSVKIGR